MVRSARAICVPVTATGSSLYLADLDRGPVARSRMLIVVLSVMNGFGTNYAIAS